VPIFKISDFLPTNPAACSRRGWSEIDIVLVSGDAYVDHPAFGVAVIGRWLEAHGFRVAILAQPDYRKGSEGFKIFGRPRLFFGITAGNLDSIVANYSGNGKIRDDDPFSPAGDPYFPGAKGRTNRRRPDRATLLYANLARAAFPGVPLILGGLEASLRRFIHYDYRQEKLRTSILADAKADLLVYGMGERAILESARRLAVGQDLAGIAGTCEVLRPSQIQDREVNAKVMRLPGWTEMVADRGNFLYAELLIDQVARRSGPAREVLVQEQKSGWLWQNPAAESLIPAELDRVYELPYTRRPHPDAGQVPAWTMIKDSLTIVRGCSGNCSFCALTRHQGARVVSRSQASIVREAEKLARQADFSGIISDLGGPTANLYGTSCRRAEPCPQIDCLYPRPCSNLAIDERAFLKLLDRVERIGSVKKVLISSGLRLALLRRTPKLLRRLIARHLPGVMKIAPEHNDPELLRLMHKNDGLELEDFLLECRGQAIALGVAVEFSPYLIASHPGSTVAKMERLARSLVNCGLRARQFQDFTPTPGTISTAMYFSGLDRDTRRPLHVPFGSSERRRQRQELEKVSGRQQKPGKSGAKVRHKS